MGSDGVFDAMTNFECLALAGTAAGKVTRKSGVNGAEGPMAAAGAVVANAADWWRRNPGSDNITAVVVGL